MPEWVIWAVLIWLFFRVSGGARCAMIGAHHRPRVRPGGWHAGEGELGAAPRLDRSHRRAVAGGPKDRRPTREPETVEARLALAFVEGRLSMEEYEEALWRELGPKRGSGEAGRSAIDR
jgi:hypothetical protein